MAFSNKTDLFPKILTVGTPQMAVFHFKLLTHFGLKFKEVANPL